ncbi:MAG TPA: response regulator transcription factor [Tepidisphaeraceae bacterium]|jgi:DNA-binding NarL/FixJ family response regulator
MPIRVLLADDHGLVRAGIAMMLRQQKDIEIIAEAENGRGAVELAGKLSPQVVVMDISMPDLNGIDATHRILQLSPAPKVLALSGHTDQKSVVEILRAGASGYVVKNAPAEELLLAIRTVADGKSFLSPQIAGTVLEDLRRKPANTPAEFTALSLREREVLQLMAEGKTTKEIAKALNLSKKTVDNHRAHLMEKLHVSNLAELIKYAIREGLTSVNNS